MRQGVKLAREIKALKERWEDTLSLANDEVLHLFNFALGVVLTMHPT